MNAITTVLFCHDIFSHEYPQKVKDVIKKTQQKMEQKKYTRSELLKYIRMNKPMPNHPISDSYWNGLTKEQDEYLRVDGSVLIKDVSTPSERMLLPKGDPIVVEDGYILPYEPKYTPPFDLELEKHQYMKDQIDKVMGQYKEKPCADIPAGYTRETFLNTLASTLTAAEINVSVGVAEKIYKLYNLVQIHGDKIIMKQITEIKNEK